VSEECQSFGEPVSFIAQTLPVQLTALSNELLSPAALGGPERLAKRSRVFPAREAFDAFFIFGSVRTWG
jgi:hypothetical protein